MKALVTAFVLLVVAMAGAVSFFSINRDPLAGEPYASVTVEPGSFEKMVAALQAKAEAQAAAKAKAIAEAKKKQAAEASAQAAAGISPENTPIIGQMPKTVEIDPSGGITATVVPD